MKKAQMGLLVFFLLVVIIILGGLVVWQMGDFSITGKTISSGLINSPVVSQTYQVSDFNQIRILGKGNLFLRQGSEYSVKIEAQESILEILDIEVEGDTLVIGKRRSLFLTPKPIDIYVTMPEVKEVRISGSGNIISETEIAGEELRLIISGSGKIDMLVDVKELETRIAGSGNANYKGKAIEHKIIVSGSGRITALDLMTEETEVTISGSGSAEVYATEELDVKVSGSGKVKYQGNPEITQSVSGSGKVLRV